MANETTTLFRSRIDGLPPLRDVVICTLSYVVAMLFVLTPLSDLFHGTGSKHLVATTTVWFHPIRPRGNLIEVLLYTLKLLALAVCLCLGAMGLVQTLNFFDLPQDVGIASLTLWLGSSLGLLGFLKMRASNPSFNTASSAAIIFMVSVLLKEKDAQFGNLPVTSVLHYLEMVGTGAMISAFVSFVFYRKTSLEHLQNKTGELEICHAQMVRKLVRAFGGDLPSEINEQKLEVNATLASLKQQAEYARYERLFSRNSKPYGDALQHVRSLEHQGMLVGGMIHCVSTVRGLTTLASKEAPKQPRQSQADSSFTSTYTATTNIFNIETLRPSMSHLADALAGYADRTTSIDVLRKEMDGYLAARDSAYSGPVMTLEVRSSDTLESDVPILDGLDRSDKAQTHHDGIYHGIDGIAAEQAAASCALLAHHLQDFASEICPDIRHVQQLHVASAAPRTYRSPEPDSYGLEHAMYHKKSTNAGLGPRLWRMMRVLRSRNVLHGIRVGMGAVILSLPAYLTSTRETFQRWHGEWAVITYMIIMARNLGAMSHNIPLRLVGTTIGALIGIGVSLICSGYGLILWSSVVCFICYRRILSKTNPVFGRFILLSYNLVSLYQYSQRNESDSIVHIAFHRVVSVTIGVLWAVFITVTIWPHSARQELRSKLCIQWMRMGMSWKNDLLAIFNGEYKGISGERELQNTMFKLEGLLKICPYEIRLRGEFDPAPYKQLLESSQTMLDAFHSLNTLIKDEPQVTPGEYELLQRTDLSRRELCHLMFLQFYTASTSVRLGFPVPEFMPPPDLALHKFAKTLRKSSVDNSDFVLFYTYMTVVMTLSSELKRIHDSLRHLFGALDDDILFAYV